MPVYEVTSFFAAGKNGFTESYYRTANTRDEAIDAIIALTNVRVNMLGRGNFCQAVRASNVDVENDSRLVSEGFTESNLTATDRDPVWTAIHAAAYAGIYRRTLWLRALSDSSIMSVPPSNKIQVGPGLWNQFVGFRQALVLNQMAIRANDRGQNNPRHLISAITVDPATNTYRFQIPGMTLNVNDEFQAYRSNQGAAQRANGVHTVMTVGENNLYTTFTPWEAGTALIFPDKAYARKISFIYPQIDEIDFRDVRKRDTGRLFFVTAGRQ